MLRYRDIASAGDGYILFPRAGAKYPIFISIRLQIISLSLCQYLRRGRGPGRNRIGDFPLDGFILPGRNNLIEVPSVDDLHKYRRIFQSWLEQLGQQANVRISVNQLILLSRSQVLCDHPATQAFDLLGQHLQHPIPVDQIDLIEGFTKDFDLTGRKQPAFAKAGFRMPKFTSIHEEDPQLPQNPVHPSLQRDAPLIEELRKIVIKYIRSDKYDKNEVRKQTCDNLMEFIQKREKGLGLISDEDWHSYFEELGDASSPRFDFEIINITFIAKWIHKLINDGAPPNTISARLNDILVFCRSLSSMLILQLDTQKYLSLVYELSHSPASRLRLVDSIKGLYRFVATQGIPIPSINWWAVRSSKTIHTQPLLDQQSIQKILDYFLKRGEREKTLVIAILLGYYFGLRVSEITNLRLADVELQVVPTVYVWRSKGDKSRFVRSQEIPQNVLEYFRAYIAKRYSAVSNDRYGLLIASTEGGKVSRQQIISAIEKAFQECDINIQIGEKISPTHLLRHACANRWFLLGIPLIMIAERLGHKYVDTLNENYLHIGPFFQKKFLSDDYSLHKVLKGQVAVLLGISTKRLSQILVHEEIEICVLEDLLMVMKKLLS